MWKCQTFVRPIFYSITLPVCVAVLCNFSGLRDMCRDGSDLSDLHYRPLAHLRVEQIGKLHNNLLFNVEMLDAQICLALLE